MPSEYQLARGSSGIREHVRVAEEALGKKLPPGAQVHHVNGDKRDNRNSNLVICENQEYHSLLHVRARVLRAGGDPDTQRICWGCRRLTLIEDMRKRMPTPNSRRTVDGLCRFCAAAKASMHYARKRMLRVS